MKEAHVAGPLDGYRIIDVTQMLSGPMSTQILGDQGADVIKIEPVGQGDLTRALGGSRRGISASFAIINRNKRSVAIDLKDARGLELLMTLVRGADLFVQNFRPGAADRMGIGEAALRAVRPDLIYVSISGFGETGPYVHKRVYDPVVQALSGLAAIQGDPATGRPRMMRLIVPDKVTALTAAQAMTAALLARERTGAGQHVRLAMLDAVVAFLWAEGMAGYTFVDSDGRAFRQTVHDLIYETADGYITAGAVSDREWQGLARALGHPEWLDDERFKTPAGRIKVAEERLALTADALRTMRTADALARLEAEQVPSAPVLSREDLLRDPQIRANELIVESVHPHAGRMRQPRPAARFDRTAATLRRAAPLLGEHTDEVLAAAGVAPVRIAELRAAGVIA
jgi:crotonobetainyl-CoA:carnitine CoA-transferase CaiB-like acyl-CoA transferase